MRPVLFLSSLPVVFHALTRVFLVFSPWQAEPFALAAQAMLQFVPEQRPSAAQMLGEDPTTQA